MSSSSSNWELLISNLSKMIMGHTAHKAKSTELHLHVLQLVKKHFATSVDYRTYRLSDRFLRFEKTVSSCVARLVGKIKLQGKAYSFNPKDTNAVTGFLTSFYLAYGRNHFHEEGFMWVLLYFVLETLSNALNSISYTENSFTPPVTSVRNQEQRSRKLLLSY